MQDLARYYGELAAAVQRNPNAGPEDVRREVPQLRDVDQDTLVEWIAAARQQSERDGPAGG